MRLDHLLSKEKVGIERLPKNQGKKKRRRGKKEFRSCCSIFRDQKKRTPGNGGVAQLGEHLPCKQGVKGSIPFISTTVRTERADIKRRNAKDMGS